MLMEALFSVISEEELISLDKEYRTLTGKALPKYNDDDFMTLEEYAEHVRNEVENARKDHDIHN